MITYVERNLEKLHELGERVPLTQAARIFYDTMTSCEYTNEYKTWFVDSLARTMHDYLALACIAEVRYCKNYHIPVWFTSSINTKRLTESFSRDQIYEESTIFSPHSIFLNTLPAFKYGIFDSKSVGGRRWARIAESGLLYYKPTITNTLFIDNVFNITHNGGIAWGKGPLVTFSGHGLTMFLNHRMDFTGKGCLNPSHNLIDEMLCIDWGMEDLKVPCPDSAK